MSWAGLANNQTVSFNNLQDAVDNSIFTSASAITSSMVTVFISICGTNPDGNGDVNVYAYSSVAVNTSINVPVKWTGDLYSELTGTITISSGQSCGTTVLSGAAQYEIYSNMTFTGDISPTSYNTQDYETGSDVDSPNCTTC